MAHLWPKSLETQILENQKSERPFQKEYVVHLGIAPLWEGSERLPGWFRANFPSVKILDFRSAKVFARTVCGKKGSQSAGSPARWGYSLEKWCKFSRLHFSATPEIVQPGWCIYYQQTDEKYSWNCSAWCVSIIIKRMKNTQHEKISILLSKRMKNTQHEKTANALFYQALHTSTAQTRRYFPFWKMIFSQDQEYSSFEGLYYWYWEVQLLRHWTLILGD